MKFPVLYIIPHLKSPVTGDHTNHRSTHADVH